MDSVKARLKKFLKTIPNSKGKIGMSEGEFEKFTGLSNSAISNIGNSLHPDTVMKIKGKYPQLNEMWLLHGQEPMLLTEPQKDMDTPKDDSSKSQAKDNPVIPQSALYEMLAINKSYADAQLRFSEAQKNFSIAHLDLTQMLKEKSFTVNELREIQLAANAKLNILQELLIDVGTGKSWKSHEEGRSRMNKLFDDIELSGKASGTHGDADS